jgi:hypothetical protein
MSERPELAPILLFSQELIICRAVVGLKSRSEL